ncbi:MAG: alpha/beta fold hydrolase [Acidimicrobiales bacterium]
MATFVLVHGGGHGGWCWQPLATRLRARGHEVHTPTLTGVGERSHVLLPGIDLDLHIQDVVAMLDFEDCRNVILVGHSYGGMVITGVADRAGDRIDHLVYLDAATPRNGQSLVDVAPGLMDFARADAREVDGVELVLWPGPEAGRFYGVTDERDLEWMQSRLTPQPWKTFAQPLHLTDEAAVDRIDRTDIVCRNALSEQEGEKEDRSAGADRVWTIETGHDLMITEPDAVAEMLQQVADLPDR